MTKPRPDGRGFVEVESAPPTATNRGHSTDLGSHKPAPPVLPVPACRGRGFDCGRLGLLELQIAGASGRCCLDQLADPAATPLARVGGGAR